ncbi:uncharacterized protein TRAVEDRAFT_124283, partial [Trametes versicolor FP-101664 SS1]|uniref:uncharacterized protein n=1 Tax=Trametes versicolor (strain FP-101664) TaxID=717944 RepID=UPI000462499E
FGTLKDVADANSRNYAYGYMDEPFSLRVNRPGCEFDGPILPNRNSHKSQVWNAKKHDLRWELHTRLQQWYNSASVSGFGDVREQVTKIDESVRTAREINTSEFTVGDELLRRVENIWKEQFVPGCDVRAEPYKIHLYGPGGHFDTHRDTPQKDLMGTFLVGLGDTADHGALVVDGKHLKAHPGSWCAFYPDVPHEVTRLSDGYRAVVAFKIFRASSSTGAGDGDTQKTAEVRRRLAEVVPKMKAPYGLLLEHKYCLGTDEFSGFDGLLVDAVRAHSSGRFDVHHLPVVVSSWSVWGSENDDPYEEYAVHCSTNVYPFTNGHIDYLNSVPAEKSYGSATHTACGCAWLEDVKDLQFYAVDLSRRTMFPFKHETNETCNHVGNEAQAWREDSVYLSYALLVLPNTTAKEGAEEVSEEDGVEGLEEEDEDEEGSYVPSEEEDGEEEEDSEDDESGEEASEG